MVPLSPSISYILGLGLIRETELGLHAFFQYIQLHFHLYFTKRGLHEIAKIETVLANLGLVQPPKTVLIEQWISCVVARLSCV